MDTRRASMLQSPEIDLEKSAANSYVRLDSTANVPIEYADGDTWYARAQHWAEKHNMEQRSIDRVPEDERTDTSLLNVCTMWLSPNMVMGHFAVGVLSQAVYGLGVADALLVILFANLAGMLPVCYFACFGSTFGLRQMILSRFWFGWYGVRIVAFVSVFSGLGWSCINIIVGAELVHAVSNDIPGWVAILVIAICTFAITLFGYKVVHMYETWAWLPNFIVYLILLGIFIHSGDYEHIPMGTGSSEVSGVLSFFAVVFGTVISPSVMAADYTVYQPVTQSKWKIFVATGMGLALPSMFTESIAVIVMTATKYGSGESNRFLDGYNEAGAGGLIGAVLIPSLGGFGRFCMIIMALSTIAINCANIYSVSLNIKVLGRWTEVVPRFIWAGVAAVVYATLAIIAFSNFETVLNNFMGFITYWATIYASVALTEHFVFRKGFSGYAVEDYNNPSKLPRGFAAIFSLALGAIGVAMGMTQTWYNGPLSTRGDIGWELGCSFAIIGLLVARPIELYYLKR